jgi:ubiquinone/menaquinone biosynthesis C-methylase UbiE
MAKIAELAGDSVLDVGCANGAYVAFCQHLGKRAYGLDLDSVRLQRATFTFCAFFIKASAEALPFGDGSFDTVMMWDVLEHTENDRSALSEAIRVARKNVLLSIPKQDLGKIFDSANGLTYRHYTDLGHKRYYTPEDVLRLIERLGDYHVTIEHWCRIYPIAVYKGIGIPRLITGALDRFLWLLGRNKEPFLRNLFVRIDL